MEPVVTLHVAASAEQGVQYDKPVTATNVRAGHFEQTLPSPPKLLTVPKAHGPQVAEVVRKPNPGRQAKAVRPVAASHEKTPVPIQLAHVPALAY